MSISLEQREKSWLVHAGIIVITPPGPAPKEEPYQRVYIPRKRRSPRDASILKAEREAIVDLIKKKKCPLEIHEMLLKDGFFTETDGTEMPYAKVSARISYIRFDEKLGKKKTIVQELRDMLLEGKTREEILSTLKIDARTLANRCAYLGVPTPGKNGKKYISNTKRSITLDGINYSSISDAATKLGVARGTIRFREKKEKDGK